MQLFLYYAAKIVIYTDLKLDFLITAKYSFFFF